MRQLVRHVRETIASQQRMAVAKTRYSPFQTNPHTIARPLRMAVVGISVSAVPYKPTHHDWLV